MSGSRRRRERGRFAAAALAGLAGLGVLTMTPAGLALGFREYLHRQTEAALAAQHQVGTEVRDGPVVFTVHNIFCGPEPETENGQLCQVTIAARNEGTEEITVPGNAQLLYGSKGARLRPVPGDEEPFGKLAPGQTATATIPYDIPAASKVTHVEVHATAYTRGQPVYIDGRPLPLLAVADRPAVEPAD
ncbi:MAG TPA: DUF4352 domain-containing protein [Natronosporangium sp.]